MTSTVKKFTALSVAVLLLAGCSQNGGMDGNPITKGNVGTVLGGAGGAILGSNIGKGKGNIAAIAVGTLLGAAIGNSVGSSLDKVDRMYAEQTAQNALETGRSGAPVTWRNPDSGNYGTVVPMNVSQNSSGDYCREYRQTVYVGGKSQEAYGTACRQQDGTWKIVQ